MRQEFLLTLAPQELVFPPDWREVLGQPADATTMEYQISPSHTVQIRVREDPNLEWWMIGGKRR